MEQFYKYFKQQNATPLNNILENGDEYGNPQ